MTSSSGSPLRRKSVETVIHQNDPVDGESHGLAKRLTTKDLIGFGIGMIIGTGIFTLTGVQAKNAAGPAVAIVPHRRGRRAARRAVLRRAGLVGADRRQRVHVRVHDDR